MLCLNIATIYDKLNQPIEVLKWYDQGIALERRQGGDFVAESKAVYLAERGEVSESLALYEALLTRETLDEQAKERIRQNITVLRGHTAR